MQAGFITALPDNAPPLYAHFNVVRGSLSGNAATITVAQRTIVSRSNSQSWDEGPLKFYAETITYSIAIDPLLAKVSGQAPTNLQLRLVLVFDPARGAWAVYNAPGRGTTFPNDAVNLLIAQIAKTPIVIWPYLNNAKTQASSQILQELLASGPVKRSAYDPGVLDDASASLAYYTGYAYNIQGNSTLQNARDMCGRLTIPHYGPWRLPSIQELQNVIVGNLGGGNARFADTPDRKLWGTVIAPVTEILTSNFSNTSIVVLMINPNGNVIMMNGPWGDPQNMVVAFPGQVAVRVICVTNL